MILKTSFHIKLRNELLSHLRKVAKERNVTMTSIIEGALEDRFAGVAEDAVELRAKLAAAGHQ